MKTPVKKRQRQTISLLLENDLGAVMRALAVFRRGGLQLESLAVGVSENPTLARMTVVVQGDEATTRQAVLQVQNLVDVVQATAVDKEEAIGHELVLVKVSTGPQQRSEIFQIADAFRAKVVDVSPDSLVLAVAGTGDKIQALLTLMEPVGVREVSRSGLVAMSRGSAILRLAGEPAAPVAGD